MLYGLPVVGWIFGLIVHISLAIPFWFCWNRLASTYFYFLPSVYHVIGFWEIVGLFIVISILKTVLLPRFSVSSKSENKTQG